MKNQKHTENQENASKDQELKLYYEMHAKYVEWHAAYYKFYGKRPLTRIYDER